MPVQKADNEVWDAIARRDSAALRQMASSAPSEEGRMWMTLLARMLELDAKRRQQQRSRRPVSSITARGEARRAAQ